MTTRHLVTIDDLSDQEIDRLFILADEFLDKMGTPQFPYRVRGRIDLASSAILSTLFYEPSTRTRFSFEAAMLRLGGGVLAFGDPMTTSAVKGESIADTVRVIESYADIIVIRHPNEGAARLAAEFSSVPVINAGDGGHEHPTQTLCDLYTLRREKKSLKGLSVLLFGDLKHGRTVHSLVYALARFGANIIPSPAKGLDLPEHVTRRLATDYSCVPVPVSTSDSRVDVVYVAPTRPHQPSLLPVSEPDVQVKVSVSSGEALTRQARKLLANVDVCYVTRLQRERIDKDPLGEYPIVDKKFLRLKRYDNAQVMHPLPRVDELAYELDSDRRGVYFKQAAYGVPVRMALMVALLGLRDGILDEEAPAQRHPLFPGSKSVKCQNEKCVTNLASEQRYLLTKFRVVERERVVLRCMYCDNEMKPGKNHASAEESSQVKV